MVATAIELFLPDEAATARLGEDLAMALQPGDLLALSGDLGVGKSTLARALVRALADDAALDVPSPTFTLVQSYETRLPVHHFDLYRLSSPEELDELGFDEALAEGAALVEWPERAEERLPPGALTVELLHEGEGRLARLSGTGAAMERIARSLALRGFLEEAGWGKASRRYLAGDASPRGYETVALEGGAPDRILMNAPALVPGPPVRDGRAYAEIAHTARSVAAFVAVDLALKAGGVCVPEIFAQDLEQGFLLIEHLGKVPFLDEGRPVAERYAAAAELLAMMHRRRWPYRMAVAPGIFHDVPPFDRAAMMIEVDLLLDWYVPAVTAAPATDSLRAAYACEWNALFDRLEGRETTLMLRDFHSPNIIWRAGRSGHDRLGIIDFQDALVASPAYDMASLALDARVRVPPEIEGLTLETYIAARSGDEGFDSEEFRESYAIMAAQRNSKILGIFVRLDRRDGKPGYLKHLPHIRDYLRRALAHPSLAGLRALYEVHGLLEERSL